eukprot:gene9847-7734_t
MKLNFSQRGSFAGVKELLPRHFVKLGGVKRNVVVRSSPLDTLKRENDALKGTIEGAKVEIEMLEKELKAAGLDIPAPPRPDSKICPEDYWTPMINLSKGGELVETVSALTPIPAHDGTECFKWDNYMTSSTEHFKHRWDLFKRMRHAIDVNEGGMDKFTQGYKHFGLNRGEKDGKKGIWYREWAPAAKSIALVGEFNDWKPTDTQWAVKNDYGVFELFLADKADGTSTIPHRTKVKCRVETSTGKWCERLPAWIKWATQEWNEIQFNGVYYCPPEKGAPGEINDAKSYTFKYPRPQKPRALRIYECHIGMSSEEPKINSYIEFRRDMLPRIRKAGYNAIQIMAVQEHAYYGSFGYHVTNFFAASSRFGTPDELKAMIDEAHRMGIVVLMDIVHSHASKNTDDGLNMFDGTDSQYFHGGERGDHWMWDSRLFNYGNWELLRFLLSNARWWIDEYKFDGYRFDGVTSMMYHHHGLNFTFTGNYKEYFGMNTDTDAVVYLMLVNNMLHDFFPSVITIGEDVSGMPAFCRPWQEGGVGFDYRLQMAIADKWIETLKTKDDEAWDMTEICHTMTNRRQNEACVGYAESHDQSIVGDKTIAFWLMDKAMYDCMAAPGYGNQNSVVDRGIALHKMIRAVTIALGGESYLNFMGNEFGNGGSLEKCRRRWDLCDDEKLRYKTMLAYDRALMHLDKGFGFQSAPHIWVSRQDSRDSVIVCERGDLVFVFNFHPTNSYTNYRVGCKDRIPYKVVLTSDEEVFGGYKNVAKEPTNQPIHQHQPANLNARSLQVVLSSDEEMFRGYKNVAKEPANQPIHQHQPTNLSARSSQVVLSSDEVVFGGYKNVVLSSDEEVFGGYKNVTKESNVTFTAEDFGHDGRPHSFLVYAPSRTVVIYAPSSTCDPTADCKPQGIPGLGVKGLGPYYAC